ncbi:DegT/DnrJ/EryC1/StrS aminotransferase family protein [Halobacteriovorax sp. BALOs_7]|uniref:DegT/DnrJ/EryC1/StrS family aminotransferase n=1 Tax=unclassified Halobacteriovorax TaxID=2639665 RepID=UPI000EA1E1B2|nr:DegT/DnrJ/EryC1/StrS family aminotransferase [Halobacteriovorax sp. BALOs_7]AYF45778.1 DegT/DnrJ/EryC1/StrS aminotransferase family protein [Halobacteriovorax sp. BALOs_7]
MKIPFFRPYIGDQLGDQVREVLLSGNWTGGPKVVAVEDLLIRTLDLPNCVCTNSGTSALEIILDVLFAKKGAKIVVPVNTFTTTAEVPKRLGHNVIFCDVDAVTGMIDINHLSQILSELEVDAVIPVSIAGFLYDRKSLIELKKKYNFKIIEDFAQLSYPSCFDSNVDATFFSFYPNKIFSTPDGGAAIFNDSSYVDKAKKYRLHGIAKDKSGSYDIEYLGRKSNMTDIVAVILNDQVKVFEYKREKRRQIYEQYLDQLDEEYIQVRELEDKVVPSLFTINVKRRDDLRKFLSDHGVQTSIHFKPLHLHRYWADGNSYKGARSYCDTTLSLPFYESLKDDEIIYVSVLINRFYSC